MPLEDLYVTYCRHAFETISPGGRVLADFDLCCIHARPPRGPHHTSYIFLLSRVALPPESTGSRGQMDPLPGLEVCFLSCGWFHIQSAGLLNPLYFIVLPAREAPFMSKPASSEVCYAWENPCLANSTQAPFPRHHSCVSMDSHSDQLPSRLLNHPLPPPLMLANIALPRWIFCQRLHAFSRSLVSTFTKTTGCMSNGTEN
jgi:hypothetical protein